MLITYLTATACAVAAICLGRSEYEKKGSVCGGNEPL